MIWPSRRPRFTSPTASNETCVILGPEAPVCCGTCVASSSQSTAPRANPDTTIRTMPRHVITTPHSCFVPESSASASDRKEQVDRNRNSPQHDQRLQQRGEKALLGTRPLCDRHVGIFKRLDCRHAHGVQHAFPQLFVQCNDTRPLIDKPGTHVQNHFPVCNFSSEKAFCAHIPVRNMHFHDAQVGLIRRRHCNDHGMSAFLEHPGDLCLDEPGSSFGFHRKQNTQ